MEELSESDLCLESRVHESLKNCSGVVMICII